MTEWNDGYVVDASYTEQAFPQLTPGWLSFAALLHGQPPLDATLPLTFMELGCGNGLTSCLVAATNPRAMVWGYDFNPAHVARARQHASAAGLTNCTFEEVSFEELARSPDAEPLQVDVIALHGVYSWITAENRRHVVAIIRRRLVPGGIAYVSYSVPCGWTNLMPIQDALRLHVAGDRRRSDVAIRSAMATIQQLADDGVRSFPLGPREQSYLDRVGTHDPAYVAHEFLGGSFHPMMFCEVADDLAAAKCTFVGGADPASAIVGLTVPPDLRELVRSAPDVALRETLADLSIDRTFRTDVFRRGLAPLRLEEHRRFVDAVSMVWTGAEYEADREVALAGGTVRIDEAFYRPLVERLTRGALSGAEIREVVRSRNLPESEVGGTLALLVASSYALPALPSAGRAVEPAARMNRALVERARLGNHLGFLVAPATGTMIGIDFVGMLTAGAVWDGAVPAARSLTETVGQQVRQLGLVSAVTGRDVADGSFDETVAAAVARVLHQMTHVFPALGIEGMAGPAAPVAIETDAAAASIGPPRIRPDVAWVQVESDVLAVDGAGRAHVIEGTGALLWPLLDGSADAADLAADVADVFDVDADKARSDVETFLADVGRGLVVRSAPPEPTSGSPPAAPAPPGPPQPGPMAPPDPVWVGALALEVGGHTVGLGVDRADLAESLSELFGTWLSKAYDDAPVDFGVSVDRRGGRGPRLIPALLWGRSTLLKSRSLARLYRRLNTALGALVVEADASTVRLSGFAAIVRGDCAALVPASLAERSSDVELAVAAGGAGIAETAAIRLDPVKNNVVVTPGLVAENGLLVDDIMVAPGHYELRSVFWPEGEIGGDERLVNALARMAESVVLGSGADRQTILEQLVALRNKFDPRPMPRWGIDLSAVLGTLA